MLYWCFLILSSIGAKLSHLFLILSLSVFCLIHLGRLFCIVIQGVWNSSVGKSGLLNYVETMMGNNIWNHCFKRDNSVQYPSHNYPPTNPPLQGLLHNICWPRKRNEGSEEGERKEERKMILNKELTNYLIIWNLVTILNCVDEEEED